MTLTDTIRELREDLNAHDPACLRIFALRKHIETVLCAAEKAERYEKALRWCDCKAARQALAPEQAAERDV